MDADTFKHDHPIRLEIARVYAWEQAAWAGHGSGSLSPEDFQAARQSLDQYKGQLIQRLLCRDVDAYVAARLRFAPLTS